MTDEEAILWKELRDRQLAGLKFRAQHPTGRFIFDFYCAEVRLVVEIDGGAHIGKAERDAQRTSILASYGYHVIRFTNDEVVDNLLYVLETIKATAEALRISPSPKVGRGG